MKTHNEWGESRGDHVRALESVSGDGGGGRRDDRRQLYARQATRQASNRESSKDILSSRMTTLRRREESKRYQIEDAPGDKENHEKITHDNVRHVSKENDR